MRWPCLETSAKLFEERAKLIEKAAVVASDTIDVVEQLAADGNPRKRQLAEVVTRNVEGAMGHLASGRVRPQEATVPLEENPFSGNSSESAKGLPGSQRALPHASSGETAPQKKGGGRPKGSKNRPKE